ncbi:MAG: hypothetical protein WC584_00695 [Candidatus Pacearchaeota archaeon]
MRENISEKVFKDEKIRNRMEVMDSNSVERLKEENKELKIALSLCLNKPLVKRLSEAVKRIDDGEYYSEEEFFKNSRQLAA